MSEKLVPLDMWARARYGEHAPGVGTLRRWAREGKIFPVPKKHGRAYYVNEEARYVDYRDPDFVKVLRDATTTQ